MSKETLCQSTWNKLHFLGPTIFAQQLNIFCSRLSLAIEILFFQSFRFASVNDNDVLHKANINGQLLTHE
jgi:hypothetical protein